MKHLSTVFLVLLIVSLVSPLFNFEALKVEAKPNLLNDNFNDNSIDTSFWNALESGGTVTEQNQQLEVTCSNLWDLAGLVTKDAHNLTDCDIQVDVNNDNLSLQALVVSLTKTTNSDPRAENDWYLILKSNSFGRWYVQANKNGTGLQNLAFGAWSGASGSIRIVVDSATGNITFYEEAVQRYTEAYNLTSYICYVYIYGQSRDVVLVGMDVFDNFLAWSGVDNNAPTSSDITHCNLAGAPCKISCNWTDAYSQLDWSGFTHNNTGAWCSNVTVFNNDLQNKTRWANYTLTLNSTVGLVVGYRWFCNDTRGNMGDTGIQTLTTAQIQQGHFKWYDGGWQSEDAQLVGVEDGDDLRLRVCLHEPNGTTVSNLDVDLEYSPTKALWHPLALQNATGGVGWVTPTGHVDPDNKWTNETKAYDDDTGTYAYATIPAGGWSSFLELNVSCLATYMVRIYALYHAVDVDKVDVDIYTNGAWLDGYEGIFADKSWWSMSVSPAIVTRARIRFHNVMGGATAKLYEFDFRREERFRWRNDTGLVDGNPIDQARLSCTTENGTVHEQACTDCENVGANDHHEISLIFEAVDVTANSTYYFRVTIEGLGLSLDAEVSEYAYMRAGVFNLNLRTVDDDGNVLTETYVYMYNGTWHNKQVNAQGWANWTDIGAVSVNVSATWYGLTVNTTFSITMDQNRTMDVSCLAYPYTPGGTRFWVASNRTITNTVWSSDIMTVETVKLYQKTYENLTNYVEVDPGVRINYTATHVDAILRRDEDARLYKDKGANYFGTSWEHFVDVRAVDILIPGDFGVVWALSNNVDDLYSWRVNNNSYYAVYFYNPGNARLFLEEKNGVDAVHSDYYNITVGTWYYLIITKTATSLSCKIYGDSARANLLDTLSLTVTDNAFRYVFACNTFNDGAGWQAEVDVENLALQATVQGTPTTLVASCTSKPSYVLNCSYDYATDFSTYLTLTHYANTTIQISHESWATTYIQRVDHRFTSVSWSAQKLRMYVNGPSSKTGTLEIYCGARGRPQTNFGFTSTSYVGSVFTGTYSLASQAYVWVDWATPAGGDPTGGGTQAGVSKLVVDFPLQMLPTILVAKPTAVNVTFTFDRSNLIFLDSISFGEHGDWFTVQEELPFRIVKFEEGDQTVTIQLTLLIPAGTETGTYEIPCQLTISDAMTEHTVNSVLEFTLLRPVSVPDIMTYVFFGLLFVFFVGTVGWRVKKRKKK